MEAARFPTIHVDRRQLGLIGLLLGLALFGWFLTDDRMAGMDAGPGTELGSLGFYVTAWVVMMAAMMFPSMAPMVLTYDRIQRRRRALGRDGAGPGCTTLFVSGYLLAWTAYGLAAYALFKLFRSLSPEALSWDKGGPYVAGGVILAAAVYQLTPAKDVCLRHCRSPLDFIVGHFREGYGGALRVGFGHGAWCVGCCWALMAALFAVGVMSIGWMVFVAALIATEKLLPWKVLANRGVALLLVILGLAVALVPDRVPGLTMPDSAQARQSMMRMNGGSMNGPTERQGDSMKKPGSMEKPGGSP
jgi:predicted metal-binding membrane protein